MPMILLIALLSLINLSSATCQEVSTTKLGVDVLVFEEPSGQGHITVISTGEGLVVVDTFYSPALARKARSVIDKEFPGLPVRYVILTHFHGDHVYGHQYFSDGISVAHVNVIDRIGQYYELAQEALAATDQEIQGMEIQLKASEPGSDEASRLENKLGGIRWRKENLSGFVPSQIDLAINSSATIVLGGKTFKIIYMGSGHTNSDLIVFVPEERLLITGDLVFYKWEPHIVLSWGGDVLNNITILDKLIQMGDAIFHVVPGHGPIGNIQAPKEHRSYLQELWAKVVKARERGLTLEQAKAEIKMEKYSHYKTKEFFLPESIESCWRMIERQNTEEKK